MAASLLRATWVVSELTSLINVLFVHVYLWKRSPHLPRAGAAQSVKICVSPPFRTARRGYSFYQPQREVHRKYLRPESARLSLEPPRDAVPRQAPPLCCRRGFRKTGSRNEVEHKIILVDASRRHSRIRVAEARNYSKNQ